ncbi:MAG: hypothetical protein R3C14_47650 [Caldilineaceae bacterium]
MSMQSLSKQLFFIISYAIFLCGGCTSAPTQRQASQPIPITPSPVIVNGNTPTALEAAISPLPLPTATLPTLLDPLLIPAGIDHMPTLTHDLLFVNQQGVQYWNHQTNQINLLIAPTLGRGPTGAQMVDRQAGPGLPIGTISALSVSRSGEKIAYVRYTGSGNGQDYYQIDLYDRTTEETITLVHEVTRLFDMALSPDGEWVAYAVQDAGPVAHKTTGLAAPLQLPNRGDGPQSAKVWVVQTNGSTQPNQVGLCHGPVSPDVSLQCTRKIIWSTDNQLAWSDAEGLWIAMPTSDSANLILQHETGAPSSIKAYTPLVWSPSGHDLLIGIGHYEGGSQAVMDIATKRVEEVSNSFEYTKPGVRLRWMADDRIVLARPGDPDEKSSPTIEIWSITDGEEALLHQERSAAIPVSAQGVPTAPFQFIDGRIGFAVLHSHPQYTLDRGLFIWDQEQIQHVADLPRSAENPVEPGIARLSGDLYWAPDGAGAILQDLELGTLVYVPTDGTPLYDLKPLTGDYVWGITWLPN